MDLGMVGTQKREERVVAERLFNAIQVVNVKTGMSNIRHNQCVGEDEVITSTSVQFPTDRKDPYTCGHCDQDIPLRQPPSRNRESRPFDGILDKD